MLAQLQSTVRRHRLLPRGRRVLVAVSGGADSVALLLALHELAPRLGIRLTVAHLNHRIRGKAADRDAAFVRRLAHRIQLPVVVGRADVPRLARNSGLSLEMAARQARYDFLAKAATKVEADVIATAHTADDQAETVLLKLIRGAGPKGLAGIPYRATLRNMSVVRPLLDVTRPEVEAFLRERGEPWREDLTNRDETFLRNKVRHRILPLLESELNPKVRQALRRTADILREEDLWLDRLAASRLARCRSATGTLAIPALGKRGLAERRRVLRLWLAEAGIPPEMVDFDAVDRINRLLAGPKTGGTANVAGTWTVTRQYDALAIRKTRHTAPPPYHRTIAIPGQTLVKEAGLKITASVAPGLIKDAKARPGLYPARASLNWAAVGNRRVTVRSWRPGDRLRPFGMTGSKKIQDIFVDEKIPAEWRPRLPLFECGCEIVWLPGYRVAQGWEVRRKTAPSLQLTVDRCGSD
ncbi:MAG: tRNA lysidine(34) synthetase TilS [Acidobacteriota bacterium]